MTVLAVVLVLSALLPCAAQAEEPAQQPAQEKLPERFMIRGGWGYVFNADTTFSINGASGVGTAVDFSRNLGGQREDSFWRIDSLYRFNDRHSIGFSYYDVNRKGNRQLNDNITIGDTTYAAGGQMNSQLDISMYRFFYNYSFHHDEKVELAGSVGLYFADIRTSFSANLICTGGPTCGGGTTFAATSDSNKLVAPLPSIGFLVNYNFTRRLQGQARFDWFYVETDQFKGAMNELYLGLEYRLFTHFSIGTAFDRLQIDLKYKPDGSSGWRVENDWNILYVYGALYF
jgi:hypothetical protein